MTKKKRNKLHGLKRVSMPRDFIGFQGVDFEKGYIGPFTRRWAPGALPSGSRAIKVATEEGDAHPLGSHCTILGSLSDPQAGLGYFVEWDALPKHAVFVIGYKIGPAPTEATE